MGKQRFWLSYTGQRGTLNQATPSAGDAVHIRGWNAGVKVNPRPRDRDEFDVYLTTGSHETGHDVHVGTVKDTPDGPAWEPEDSPPETVLRQAAAVLARNLDEFGSARRVQAVAYLTREAERLEHNCTRCTPAAR